MYIFQSIEPIPVHYYNQIIELPEEKMFCFETLLDNKQYFHYSRDSDFLKAVRWGYMIRFHQRGQCAFVLDVGMGRWHSELFAKYLSKQYQTEIRIATLPHRLTDEQVQAASPNAQLLRNESSFVQTIYFTHGEKSVIMDFHQYDGELQLGVPVSEDFREKLIDFVVRLYQIPVPEQTRLE